MKKLLTVRWFLIPCRHQMNENEMTEQMEDVTFHAELSDLVSQLPVPSAEQVAEFNKKFDLLETIHNEIRKKHPNHRPQVVAAEEETVAVPVGKYQEMVYGLGKL